MKKMIISGVMALLLASAPMFVGGQVSWTDQLSSEDSAAISALVLYPDDLRLSIFEACTHPELIVRVSGLQKASSADFLHLIENLDRTVQEGLWNLTRYPDLISRMAAVESATSDVLQNIARDYPEEVQADIMKYGTAYHPLIHQIHGLDMQSANEYAALLKSYPVSAQQAFNELIGYPEVMNLLNDHLQMAVLVGDMYAKDPAALLRTVDSLNLVAATQNAENLAAWQKTLKEDPQATAELKAAGAEYAEQNGYTESEYTTAPSAYYIEHYTCYSYPYWYGYPYWYPYYYWYPYPWWYDWGYYIDPWGNVIIFSMPSYYFTYWYFYYPTHWYHHPHLAAMYVTYYYYGPHREGDANAMIVHNWVGEHREFLPEDFDVNAAGRPDVIRDIGKLETDYQQYLNNNPDYKGSREDYMESHAKEYSHLSQPKAILDTREPVSPKWYEEKPLPPVKQPTVKPAPDVQKTPDPIKKDQPKYDFNRINKAQDRHRDTWNPTHQQPTRQPSQPTKKGGGR